MIVISLYVSRHPEVVGYATQFWIAYLAVNPFNPVTVDAVPKPTQGLRDVVRVTRYDSCVWQTIRASV